MKEQNNKNQGNQIFFFEKINKVEKSSLTKKKREKNQITKIRNESGITTNLAEIKKK